jgi:hypothetical protein
MASINQEIHMKKNDKGGTIIAFLPAVQKLLRRREGFRGFRQKEQLPLDAYDALAARMREENGDAPMILFPVPKGIVSVTISGPGVTSGVAAGALALIRDGIRLNGLPNYPLVQLAGEVNMRGPEQDSLKFETGGEIKDNKEVTEIHEEQQQALDGLSDDELEALVCEAGDDVHMIVLPVPKGFVAVGILGAEVAPAVAVAALVLIKESIRENGIPREKLLQLGGLVNIGPKSQK